MSTEEKKLWQAWIAWMRSLPSREGDESERFLTELESYLSDPA